MPKWTGCSTCLNEVGDACLRCHKDDNDIPSEYVDKRLISRCTSCGEPIPGYATRCDECVIDDVCDTRERDQVALKKRGFV